MSDSKPIKKGDDSAKIFLIDCLKGDNTNGFDLDSVYVIQDRFYIFEYLKCDNKGMNPYTSNPKYYAWNWKKFYSLWQTAQGLNAFLFLVNYSDKKEDEDKVKIMYVKDFDYDELNNYLENGSRGQCEYLTIEEYILTREEYSKYLRTLNSKATLHKIINKKPDKAYDRIEQYYEQIMETIDQPILPPNKPSGNNSVEIDMTIDNK